MPYRKLLSFGMRPGLRGPSMRHMLRPRADKPAPQELGLELQHKGDMPMNLKLIVLGVFAIVSSYLLLSIPLTSATNVKIYYNGASQSSVQYNPQSLIKKDVSVESGSVKIGISKTTAGASVERVYVYSCKGLAPDACISSVSPEAGEGNFAAAYPWNSVADRTAGYPQKANFIILVKISSAGKVFWTGFWQWIERTDASTYTAYESRTSEMEGHAKDKDDVATKRNFIAK